MFGVQHTPEVQEVCGETAVVVREGRWLGEEGGERVRRDRRLVGFHRRVGEQSEQFGRRETLVCGVVVWELGGV